MSRFLLLLVGIALVGCANPAQDSSTASLEGTFKSSYGDGFKVSGTEFTSYQDAANTIAFTGTISNSPDLSAESGTLILLITFNNTDTEYPYDLEVGKYYAARWKGLKAAGVQESNAYADPMPKPASLEAAQTAFASDGLYTYYGEYARQ